MPGETATGCRDARKLAATASCLPPSPNVYICICIQRISSAAACCRRLLLLGARSATAGVTGQPTVTARRLCCCSLLLVRASHVIGSWAAGMLSQYATAAPHQPAQPPAHTQRRGKLLPSNPPTFSARVRGLFRRLRTTCRCRQTMQQECGVMVQATTPHSPGSTQTAQGQQQIANGDLATPTFSLSWAPAHLDTLLHGCIAVIDELVGLKAAHGHFLHSSQTRHGGCSCC